MADIALEHGHVDVTVACTECAAAIASERIDLYLNYGRFNSESCTGTDNNILLITSRVPPTAVARYLPEPRVVKMKTVMFRVPTA